MSTSNQVSVPSDLISQSRAPLEQGNRVAAVKLFRTETRASLPAAMRVLGLK